MTAITTISSVAKRARQLVISSGVYVIGNSVVVDHKQAVN